MSLPGFGSGRCGWAAMMAEMALAAVVAAGCATSTRLPSEIHTKAVLSGQGAIVLLRLQGEVDGALPKPQQFLVRLVNLDGA